MGCSLCLVSATVQAGPVLDAIKKRDAVRCGVSSGVAGFSAVGSDGQWRGLDVAVCRAVAAAVLGSDPQSMLHLLAHLDATYGGIHPYLDRIGLTPATVDALCARIIDMEATA